MFYLSIFLFLFLFCFLLFCFIYFLFSRGLLAASSSLKKTILAPFIAKDLEKNGFLSFSDFSRIFQNFNSSLNSEEIIEIANRYRAFDQNPKGRKDDFNSNNTYNQSVSNLRSNEIRGAYLFFFRIPFFSFNDFYTILIY